MSRQSFEFELLAPTRDGSGGQQQQYSKAKWPYDVDAQCKCEFQYQVFREAYLREQRCPEGNYYTDTLSDAELRHRWLDYYVCYKDPSTAQISRWAYEVSRGKGRLKRSQLDDADPWQIVTFVVFLAAIAVLFF